MKKLFALACLGFALVGCQGDGRQGDDNENSSGTPINEGSGSQAGNDAGFRTNNASGSQGTPTDVGGSRPDSGSHSNSQPK